MAYYDWGDPDNPRVLICVHGLVRSGRDFDDFATALCGEYRVICPDVVGRGHSDWLPAGAAYGMEQYMQDMTVLIARLDVERVDWVGTSMGGIIGMLLASLEHTPIHRLVLNDIGAHIPSKALQRIGSYVGLDPRFDSLEQVEAMMRQNYLAYRGLSDDQWHHLAQHGSRDDGEGRLALHYDPVIGDYTRAAADEDVDLWAAWRRIASPQLLLWAKKSDVLTAETVRLMQQHNAAMQLATWPDIPHAPSLMEADQIEVVRDWLLTE